MQTAREQLTSRNPVKPTKKLRAIIPCRNEAKSIESLIVQVSDHIKDILVVDDGSEDHTARVATQAGAHVLELDPPGGKGAALRAGLFDSLNQGYTWALTLDGDGQHCPPDIPEFLPFFEHEKIPLVIGNRMLSPGEMPWTRRWTNRIMSRILSRLTTRDLPDTQCGFRLIKLDPAFLNQLTRCHFETESEQIVAAVHCGWDIEFVPVTTSYTSSTSQIRPFIDTLRWLLWLSRKKSFRTAAISSQ